MPSLISQSLIDRYSAGPSPSRTTQVANLQNAIRSALGNEDWDTFLQGSHRNGTAIADINDVDIVARRKRTNAPLTSRQWETLFNASAGSLRGSFRTGATVTLGDKCVKLTRSGLKADIVPAAAIGNFAKDPIAVWSRREQSQRPNYPRTHYANGVKKQQATNDAFKPTVRLFKRWARQYDWMATTAPSFYIECAVHNASDSKFRTYLPLSFALVGLEICRWTRNTVINSVAGDKDILVPSEWPPANFERFQKTLLSDLEYAINALDAPTASEANRLWKLAFGNQ